MFGKSNSVRKTETNKYTPPNKLKDDGRKTNKQTTFSRETYVFHFEVSHSWFLLSISSVQYVPHFFFSRIQVTVLKFSLFLIYVELVLQKGKHFRVWSDPSFNLTITILPFLFTPAHFVSGFETRTENRIEDWCIYTVFKV